MGTSGAAGPASPPELRPHPLTLRLPGPVEAVFQADYFANSVRPLRAALLLVGGLVLLYLVGEALLRPQDLDDSRIVAIILSVPAITMALFLATFAQGFRWLMRPLLAATILYTTFGVCAYAVIARDAVVTPIVANICVVLLMNFAFNFSRIGLRYATATSALVLVAWVYTVVSYDIAPDGRVLFFLGVAYVLTLFSGYIEELYLRRDFVHSHLLDAERDRSESLLLNILPRPIADRLKRDEDPLADAFPDATVLFADIVNFTATSAAATPQEMVRMLNDVFCDFDELAARHGLEKIKTIGDAYMVAGGLPAPRADHAEAIADMALDMLDALAAHTTPTGEPLRVRIGINTGPLVAGVIGTSKFAYDLWGDAVNTASRMESHGVPGRIQVTEATCQRLRDKYELVEHGLVEVKGKGPMTTYLLLGRR